MSFILTVALPVFAIIATGFAMGRTNYISASDSDALNRFVFRIAMPVALFGLTSRAQPPNINDLPYALAFLIISLGVLLSSYFIARRFFALPRPDAGLHAFAATLGNAVFLGLPIAQSVPGWGRPFVVLMLVEGLVIISVASIFIAAPVDENKDGSKIPIRSILMRPLQNPLVVGAASGFVYAMTDLPMPSTIGAYLDIFGKAAGPTALFSMGLFLSMNPVTKDQLSLPIVQIVLFKMVLLPTLFLVTILSLGVRDPNIIGAGALFTLVPTGIGTFIQASGRGRYLRPTATAIALTTVISVATILGALYWLGPKG